MTEQAAKIDEEHLKPWLKGRSLDDWYAEYDENGYVIFPEVMTKSEVDEVRGALAPHLTKLGRNNFEGFRSNRVYALLAKEPEVFSKMAIHPLALAFVEREHGSSCLLSAMLAINLHPGESVQGWHTDDAQINVPRPRPAYGVSTFWAIDELTETNGATELIPGSHLWDEDQIERPDILEGNVMKDQDYSHDPMPHPDAIKATMPSGSFMVAKGTLWHRGGANRSDAPRLIVTPQYCPGWARQLENMIAVTPRSVAAKLPRRVRELLGYSIHDVFMGYTDGVHPDTLLDNPRQD